MANLLSFLFPYRSHLEAELKQQRADFIERLAEKNLQLRQLRGEMAALRTATTYLKPIAPNVTTELPSKPVTGSVEAIQDWRGEMARMLDKEIESEEPHGI